MISPVTLTYFQGLFPELASAVTQGYLDAMNPVSQIYVDQAIFQSNVNGQPTDNSTYACALVIAHNLKLDEMRGGGSITMDKIGQLSTSQAALTGDSQFDLTSYGKRFKQLARIMMGVAGTYSRPRGSFVPPFSFPSPSWPSGL